MNMNVVNRGCLLFLFLSGCVQDEITIGLKPNGSHPSFVFQYVRTGAAPVNLAEVHVKESISGRTIWNLKIKDWERRYSLNETVPISHLDFGIVPEGLEQYFPTNNKPPRLEDGVTYLIYVGGAVEGMMEFTTQQECKKISLTSFTRNLPAFGVKNDC
jgi:hypothetical protein